MEKLLLLISVLIPFFSFLSTTLMTYADKHTFRIDPLSVLHRVAAVLNERGYNPSKAASDIQMELHNKKMKRIWYIGIVCLVISFLFSVAFIVLQQI